MTSKDATSSGSESPVSIVWSPKASQGSSRYRSVLSRLAPPALTVLLTMIAVTIVMQLWNAQFGIPWDYSSGDVLAHAMPVKQVIHGWYWHDFHLGAPFGQSFVDWPVPDVGSLLEAKVLGLFDGNWPAVVNAMYLLSFPLASLACWWALTRIGVSRWVSVGLGVIYAFLPFHLARAESHLFLSNYWTVPLGVYLAVEIARSHELFPKRQTDSHWLLQRLTWSSIRTLLICVAIGANGVYFIAFTGLFLLLALATAMVRGDRKRAAVSTLVVLGAIGVVFAICVAPSVLYHLQHGANPESASRQPQESDYYGLKIAQLFMPTDSHRIAALASLQERYQTTFPPTGEGSSAALGLIGGIGLVSIWIFGFVQLARTRRDDGTNLVMRFAVIATSSAILIAVVGGISTFIGMLATSEIRSWNRISVFISVFAFAAVGFGIDILLRRIQRRTLRNVALAAAVALIVVVGVYDQTTKAWIPNYKANQAAFFDDQNYFNTISAAMPANAAIFELPITEFPEAPVVNKLRSYDLLRPYMMTSDLRWSFGGVKGRIESDWQQRLDPSDPDTFVRDLVAAGFQGIYIDGYGYEDNGAAVTASLQEVIGTEPVVSNDGRRKFFDLRPVAAELQASEPEQLAARKAALLFPVLAIPDTSFSATEVSSQDDSNKWNWADGSSGAVLVTNNTSTTTSANVSFGIQSAVGGDWIATVRWPDGSVTREHITDSNHQVSRVVAVPGKGAKIEISTNAPQLSAPNDSRDLHFRINNLTVGAS